MNEKERLLISIRESLKAMQFAIESLETIILNRDIKNLESKVCQHERKKFIGTMTAPDSWFCSDCNTQFTIEPSTMVSIEQKED